MVVLAESLAVAPGAPVGVNRVLLLDTRQPFAGLGGGGAGAFVAQPNAATAGLAPDGWALAEARVEVVAAGG